MKRKIDYDRIHAVVMTIPSGRVATYGQVARLSGYPGRARQVGYALRALQEESGVPWHRVVSARGEISERRDPGAVRLQRALLEIEGVDFDGKGRVLLRRFLWDR